MAFLVLASCGGPGADEAVPSPKAGEVGAADPVTSEPSPEPDPPGRPPWLGTRALPLRPDGYGEALPTPPELQDRRLPTIHLLPPPPSDEFRSSIRPVPPDVAARSSWSDRCPVTLDQLRYLMVSFYGFDGLFHTGELLVNAGAAAGVVAVFERLHETRFPIEEMRIVREDELDEHPTGDGNNTTSFVCRDAVGSSSWSTHARGLAIDINPFHNPYLKGDLVLPELASAYLDREWERPGMIFRGDPVTRAFAGIGWSWGGEWRTLKDWMHFSADGR